MSNAVEALDGRAERSSALSDLHEKVWASGLIAAVAWAAAAIATIALPDVVPWGSEGLFAIIMASGALALVVLAFVIPRLGRFGEGWVHYGPWLIAIGVWLTLWELTTAKFGWLPKPFFSPPNGLAQRLRHRVVAAFDLHRLHAAPVVDRLRLRRGRWLRARRRARLVEVLQLLGHADPQADRTGAGDRLDSLHVLLLPDDLRRERVHRRALCRDSGRNPHFLGRRLRQSRLLRRWP